MNNIIKNNNMESNKSIEYINLIRTNRTIRI